MAAPRPGGVTEISRLAPVRSRRFSSLVLPRQPLYVFFSPQSLDAHPAHDVPELDGGVPAAADQQVAVRVAYGMQHACFVPSKHLHLLRTSARARVCVYKGEAKRCAERAARKGLLRMPRVFRNPRPKPTPKTQP